MNLDRWRGSASGRSRITGFGPLVYVVANATEPGGDFRTQAAQTLEVLAKNLQDGGSNRSRILTVQVLLQDMRDKMAFDEIWQAWIGPDPATWPQRSCIQVGLTPTLLVEIVAVAARDPQEHQQPEAT
jgi:enamine deaminase RidA (YjgF/YER057c/UK114 family)